MPFLALHLRILPLQKEVVRAEHVSYSGTPSLYNALLHMIPRNNEAGDVLLHPFGTHTHITIALLQSGVDQQSVRMTVCGQHARSLSHALLSALAERPVISCGNQSYQVLSVDLARSPSAVVSTWADLLVPSSQPALRLRLVTPTIFTEAAEGSVRGEVFPQPRQVFSTLLSRWNQLEGPLLAYDILPLLQTYACIVSDYRLQAEPIGLRTGAGDVTVYPGWRGWITYSCREPQAAWMSTLWALARLACFTGVGDYTEVGLGVTQIVESR